jgi:hypothetical protein
VSSEIDALLTLDDFEICVHDEFGMSDTFKEFDQTVEFSSSETRRLPITIEFDISDNFEGFNT